MKRFKSTNPAQTKELAKKMAALADAGLVITLNGDLGAGKTTFTKGVAEALGVLDRVKSPTFNILNTYDSGRLPLYHFDAYRLEESGAADQGFEDYLGTDGVTLIEWPQFMADLLPNDRLVMTFERTGNGEDERLITIKGLGKVAELEEELS